MNRIRPLILGALLAALALGCATTASNTGPVTPDHRVGAVNNYANPPCETLTLGVSTVHSAARLTLSIDTVSANIVNLTGTASGAYTFEGSNDNVTWFTVTFVTSPPALAGGSPTTIPISYPKWPWAYWRVTWVGTGSSGTSQVCEVLKG